VPELPEVETVRLTLRPLIGRRIASARLARQDICQTSTGKRARPADLLAGRSIVELRRRGKQLALIADNGSILLIHLGMTGQLRLSNRNEPFAATNHIHASWTIDDGSRLTFRDPRRFGGLWTLPSPEALEDRWTALGPDALTITPTTLAAAAAGSRRHIKAMLLDQTILAGVGNIYADEALFLARIRPSRRAHKLKTGDCDRLASTIRTVLAAAIDHGGSTLRDYMNANGQPGSAQLRHLVYGRAGQPCTTCGRTLRSTLIAQRTTVHCPNCQT
jgi:formamidopyrimidine-DNA glycosylase